jgi:hypothetical protein
MRWLEFGALGSKQMKRLFLEYFHCPAAYVDFRLSEDVAPRSGFFRFGPDLICYGRLSSGLTQRESSGALEDVLSHVHVEKSAAYLPFDLDDVIENLRYERYSAVGHTSVGRSFARSVVRKMYYAVRPLLPITVRKHLQRAALHGWDKKVFPNWPVDHTVDRLFDLIMSAVIRANSGERVPFVWFWPDGFSSCLIMTHDVETAAGRDFCQTLMDLDDSFGLKSSFQVIPEGRYEVTEGFLQCLRRRGFEINVHDLNHDGNLFQHREEFLRRVARINAYGKRFQAAGYRSGVLYRNLDWYDAFDYSYDMSVPNVGHLDAQPGGCCTTMPYFIGNILEIPVVATQDYTLFHILRDYSIDLWNRQIQLTLAHNGLISFIVHPDYLLEKRGRNVYVTLLARLAQLRHRSKTWFALPRELNDWWRSRSEMRLVKERNSWRIDGPNRHRARIAYASLEGNRVVYTLEKEFHPHVRPPGLEAPKSGRPSRQMEGHCIAE